MFVYTGGLGSIMLANCYKPDAALMAASGFAYIHCEQLCIARVGDARRASRPKRMHNTGNTIVPPIVGARIARSYFMHIYPVNTVRSLRATTWDRPVDIVTSIYEYKLDYIA